VEFARPGWNSVTQSINLYADELIDSSRMSGSGCFVNTTFVWYIMYADDLLLLSQSLQGMQSMLDICTSFGNSHNIVFNPFIASCSKLLLFEGFSTILI